MLKMSFRIIRNQITMSKLITLIALVLLVACNNIDSGRQQNGRNVKHESKPGGEEIKEHVLTPEQMERYAASYKDPYVLHIRKVINNYLRGKPEGHDHYEDLRAVDQEYLKNKFVLLSFNDALMGGKEILLISQKKQDKIFRVWVFKTGVKYEVRSFDVEELSNEQVQKIKIMFKRFLQDKNHAL